MGDLRQKKALVTGAGHGIGAGIVAELLRAGCDVYAHHHGPLPAPYAIETPSGTRLFTGQADLCSQDQTSACVETAIGALGGLDILVNNSGGLVERRTLDALDEDYWNRVFDINMKTMMWTTRACLPALEQAGQSAIVNVSSLAGRKGGHPGSLAYATSKGAVLTWTRALATELGPKGIRVNAVAPGLILGTKFHDTFTTKAAADATVKTIPLGRAGCVADVARSVSFLASEYDGFITGATLDINGGVYCA